MIVVPDTKEAWESLESQHLPRKHMKRVRGKEKKEGVEQKEKKEGGTFTTINKCQIFCHDCSGTL